VHAIRSSRRQQTPRDHHGDDVIDILIEEQTEDVLHWAAWGPQESVEQGISRPRRGATYGRASTGLLLFVTETLTGTVLRYYESELAKVVALSFFIPLLIGTGGNSGSQTVTTIVRGLAVGEIRLRDFGRVLIREGGSGLVLGILLGIVGFGRAMLWGSTTPLALTVGVSILVICTWANSVGAMIPMLATVFKIDPTVMSAPLIATLVDATGLIIYFTIAKHLLGCDAGSAPEGPRGDGLEAIVVGSEVLEQVGHEGVLLILGHDGSPSNHLRDVRLPLLLGQALLPDHVGGVTVEARRVGDALPGSLRKRREHRTELRQLSAAWRRRSFLGHGQKDAATEERDGCEKRRGHPSHGRTSIEAECHAL
jgi:cation transporter-like permease